DDVVLAERGAGDSLPTPPLRAVQICLGALRVPGPCDCDHHVLARYEILHGDLTVERDDPGPPFVAPPLHNHGQLVGDDLPLAFRPREDVLEVGDLDLDLRQLVYDLLTFKGGQTT